MESNLSGLVPAAGLVPALPPAVTLGLTAAYTTLYALLFFSVYAQLWLVLLYGHKRLSYQTVFLALCLLWAALRTTLFSFYFRDTPRANRLGPLPFWLLYCCPVCLQFFTLTLMNLYFAQVVFKAKAKRRPEMSRGFAVPPAPGAALGPPAGARPGERLPVRYLRALSCRLPLPCCPAGTLHQHLPGGQGDQCVPGGCHGRCHGPALCQSGLLQPGGPGLGSPEPAGRLRL
uniref:G protein-coupled receptor 137 n=1 Tax=Pipistrellus kuhlii TaxID=59472 RepID=A0A7J7RTE8_PIPKU|nr:G protein-coupled receptor 137 [Pipistrellus kuhlii]